MFERFTARARQVVVLAQEEARALKHNYIGTEHLLLGLLREGGTAAQVLDSFDATIEEVRAQVERIVGRGEEEVGGQIPFTPRAKRSLELSLRESLSLGQDYVGPEHLLLGLVREGNGVAARILLDFDVTPEKARAKVVEALAEQENLRRELERVRGEKERLLDAGDFEEAARLREQERNLTRKLSERAAATTTWTEWRSHQPEITYPRAMQRAPLAGVLLGWFLFAGALGIGIAIGWAIWG